MANKRVHSITDRALGAYGHSPADRVGNATTGPTWGGVPPAFCTAQHVTKTARLDCAYLRACSVRNAPRFAQCGQMKGRHSAPLPRKCRLHGTRAKWLGCAPIALVPWRHLPAKRQTNYALDFFIQAADTRAYIDRNSAPCVFSCDRFLI